MRTAPTFAVIAKAVVRTALSFCASNLLVVVLAAQCSNPTQVPNQTISSGTYNFPDNNALAASNVIIYGSASVTFVAGNCIDLQPGFRATAGTAGTTFHAWVETAPTADSVSPSSGSGLSQQFTWKASSPSGYNNLSEMYALFNTSVSGLNACYIRYNRGSNLLYLADNAGANWLGGFVPGSSGSASNSYCSITGSGSSAGGSGTQLTLTVSVTFQTSFSGTKNDYLIAYNNEGLNSTWQQKGTWTVTGGDTTPPVISNLPPSPTSNSATVTWTTNELSDTQIEYGTTPAYGSWTALNSTMVTSHSQTITGLQANTSYYYRARSRDAALNLGTATGSFTTVAPTEGMWVSSSGGPPAAQSCDLNRYAYCWTDESRILQPDSTQPKIYATIRPYVYLGTMAGVTLYYRGKLFLGGSDAWGTGVEVASSGDYKPLPADGTGILYVPGPTASNVVDAAVTGFGRYYLQFETYGVLSGAQTQVFRDRPISRLVAGPPTISGNAGIWYLGSASVNDNCDPGSPVPNCYYNSTQLTVTPGTGGTPPTAGSPAYWSFTDPLTGQPPTFVSTTCDDAGCSKVTIRATSQPPTCGRIEVRVTLGGISSATFTVVVDWPSTAPAVFWQDLSYQDPNNPSVSGLISNNTLQLVSACERAMFNIAAHEEFPASPTACGGSVGWTDPIPQSEWGSWITQPDGPNAGMFIDQMLYACAPGACTPQAQGPGIPLSSQANSSAPLFIFVGSQDTQTLGKYLTAQPNMQVRYTDHGRDEPGWWRCP